MLLTKLHIPSTPKQHLVHRVGLFDKLKLGLNTKLTLISAPAGFGKSTLVSDWIQEHNIPTAWFSIDANDNDTVEFLNYIILSIQKLHNDFGEKAIDLLNSPNPPNANSIISLLINDLTNLENDFILVFDDYHLITKKEISQLVSYLLEYIPPNVHVIILSRSDPTLPIAKLRSQHQLVELRSADLSFSANDISVLFNKKFKYKLSIEDILSLETKTEGWIAGLQLAALSMQGYDDVSAFIEAFAGNNRYIMDYLIEEVLQVQSDKIKNFLLKTSILKQISAPLCDKMLGINNSQEILEELEKTNMFVFPLDNERFWYRYHHLFADLLQQRLNISYKLEINELHKNACDWFETNNMHELAIDHSLKISDFEKSINLLDKVVEKMWRSGHHDAILKYGELIPDNIIEVHPEFSLYYSWILISSGKLQVAKQFLESAKSICLSNKNVNTKLLGKIGVAFAYLSSHETHSNKFFEYCELAKQNLTEEDPFWYSWALFSYGIAYFSSGDLYKAKESFDQAFDIGVKTGNFYLMSTIAIRMSEVHQQLGFYKTAYKKCENLLKMMQEKGVSEITKADWTFASLYLVLGSTEFMWCHMDKAYEHVKIAYSFSNNIKDVFLKTIILMINAYVLKEKNDPEAQSVMYDLDELMRQNDIPPYIESMHIGWRIYIAMRENNFDEARLVLQEKGMTPESDINYSNESAFVAFARLLIYEGKLAEAEKILNKISGVVNTAERIERMIDVDILSSYLYKVKGDRELAIQHMTKAMELAAPEQLVSYFVFNVDKNTDIINEVLKIQATSKTNISDEFVHHLNKAIEETNRFWNKQPEIDLSSRELDTLKLIAEELSNQEIADRLFISLNTVKTHLKNINIKLEVDSRTKAVAKAKELGLI